MECKNRLSKFIFQKSIFNTIKKSKSEDENENENKDVV